MIRWTLALAILFALGCGPSTVEGTDEVGDSDELVSGDETPPEVIEAPEETAATGGTEGSGLGPDLVGHCRELVGSGRPDTCVIDALIENASCAQLPELMECLSTVGTEADREERSRVLAESCPSS
jgi:hypothetical protein